MARIDKNLIYRFGWEWEASECSKAFKNHPKMIKDGSGPYEIKSPMCSDPKEIFEYFRRMHGVVRGYDPQCTSGGYGNCGNHIHVSINLPDMNENNEFHYLLFKVARFLEPFFVPFFAGSDIRNNEDFRLRPRNNYFGIPANLDRYSFDIFHGRDTSWWVTPTNDKNMTKHIELRIPESIPQSAFTGVFILLRITEEFFFNDYIPDFNEKLVLLGDKVIKNKINTIGQLQCVFTHDKTTTELLGNVFNCKLRVGETIKLRKILRNYLKGKNLSDWEVFWVRQVLGGRTWSKIISGAKNTHARTRVTRQYMRRYKKSTTSWEVNTNVQSPNRAKSTSA